MDLLALLKLFLVLGIINYLIPILARVKQAFTKEGKKEIKREKDGTKNGQ